MGMCLSHIIAHTLHQRHSSTHEDGITEQDLGIIPIIASPIVPEARRWLERQRQKPTSEAAGIRRRSSVDEFEAEHTVAQLAGRIFHKQHAASSLELFFDLFFVANLAVFTDQHALVDGQSVGNCIGSFSILWTTWFHVSIFDVRFYTDSIVNKVCKMLYFGIMASLVKLGSIYTATITGRETSSLEELAFLMMGLRFLLAMQYGLVLYFVYPFHKTLIPLLFMMGVYITTAFAFLVVALTEQSVELLGNSGAHHIAWWYIIIGVEAIAVIAVSAIWRVLSFKHTHLVERLGLLTLIVIGEGILALLKSLSAYLQGTDVSVWTIIGLVEAAVSLTYAIYLLYFEYIEHDRFGSIRQQIWALLHYVLHVVILLTVEGQASLVIWAAVQDGMSYVSSNFPSVVDPGSHFNSSASLTAAVRGVISNTTSAYHYADLSVYYDPTADLNSLENTTLTGPFGSSQWNTTTAEILNTIQANLQYFIFQNFGAEGPELALEAASTASEKVAIYNQAYAVVFEYFYICAGGILMVLAVMYSFGKVHKQRDEYATIALHVLFGAMLPCMSALAFLENPNATNSFRYSQSSWIIGIVTFTYLFVLFGDNLIKIVFRERIRERVLAKRSAHAVHHHQRESVVSPERRPAGGTYIKMEGLSGPLEEVHGKSTEVGAHAVEQ